jgi:uncharacterized RDD family membrane protein YckC
VDLIALQVTWLLVEMFWFPGFSLSDISKYKTPSYPLFISTYFLVRILYFALSEGCWGASPGKALFRLRVIGPSQAAPGLGRALLRAAIYASPGILFLPFVATPSPESFVPPAPAFRGFPVLALTLALFCTVRRRNGYSGLHDLVTRTRVVARSSEETPLSFPAPPESAGVTEQVSSIGPYRVLRSLGQTDGNELVLGFDPRLLRKVWIRKQPVRAPPICPALQNVGRAGRLRWLNGKHTPHEWWDAYEAVEGQPLLNLLNRAQPWKSGRFWLTLQRHFSLRTD